MKKIKYLLSAMFLFGTVSILAQPVSVRLMEKLNLSGPAYHPVLADNGKKLLVTSENYTGLQEVDLSTAESRVLSTAPKAGYNLKLSAAGNVRKLMKRADVYAVSEDFKISVYKNGVKTVLAPNGADRRYIWPSVSPDGTKVLYTVSGVGSFICNIDGSAPTALGILRAPNWVNDNWVVGMNNSTVNYVTKSSIDIVKSDGSYRQTLTPEEIVGMYPSASDGKIAFSTDSGEVYVMEIEINE